jgi:abnormal spindle-like microcephaly-associated protein
LDAAKGCILIPEDPRLFKVKSQYKSSKEILDAFGQRTLLSEGDLLKRLGYTGYRVVVRQQPHEEYEDACIRQLSTDLRDGIHLARLLETLTRDTHLVSSMKLCDVSKVSLSERTRVASLNMGTIFKYLEDDKGMDMSSKGTLIRPEDIVNGHREKTLALLWKLVSSWKIPSMMTRDFLLEEIDALTLEIREKELYWNMDILGNMPSEIRFVEEQHQMRGTEDHLGLLFEWIWCCVALQSNLFIRDFSYDFMDGNVFCSLLSYYYPTLIEPSELVMEEGESGPADANRMRRFIETVEAGLGGLPLLISREELLVVEQEDGFLDEKIIITLCAYLSHLLLQKKDKIRACKAIQRFVRRFHSSG